MGPPMHKKHGFSVFSEESVADKNELKRVLMIVNPNSGGKKGIKLMELTKPILEKGGCEVTVEYTKYAGHAKEIAQKRDLSDIDVFCPIGGDGTVHETVNGFMTREDYDEISQRIVIGIIPGGTGNTLAYDLHINTPEKACEMIIKGETMAIDVLKTSKKAEASDSEDGKAVSTTDIKVASAGESSSADDEVIYAINIVGYGLPTTVLSRANYYRFLGFGAMYKLAAYMSLIVNRGYQTQIDYVDKDGNAQTVTGKYAMVQGQLTVHMGERLAFCPDAKLDDGLIDLVLIKHGGRMKMVSTMTSAETGKHVKKANVQMLQVKSFSLTSKNKYLNGPQTVNIDGELVGSTPCDVTVMPKALRMVCEK